MGVTTGGQIRERSFPMRQAYPEGKSVRALSQIVLLPFFRPRCRPRGQLPCRRRIGHERVFPDTIGCLKPASVHQHHGQETAEIKMDIMEKSLIGESRAELVAESGSGYGGS